MERRQNNAYRTPVKQRVRGSANGAPDNGNMRYGERLMKKVESSCLEKARQRRESRIGALRCSNSPCEPDKRSVAQGILQDILLDGSFLSEEILRNEYEEIVSVIEDEYELQFQLLIKEYEEFQEESDAYYNGLQEEMDSPKEGIMCPCCCSGFIRDCSLNHSVCLSCGIQVNSPVERVRSQISEVYRHHHCPKGLKCVFDTERGMLFSCSSCQFTFLLQ